jgi:hypothetical protein
MGATALPVGGWHSAPGKPTGVIGNLEMKQFKAQLKARGPEGAWTFLEIPFSVEEAFGSKARVAVCGTINGFAFQNSLMPNGDGTHSMAVNKDLQAGAKTGAGQLVSVSMELDRSERVVSIPVELKTALAANKKAAAAFDSLSYSHWKEFAQWVADAKMAETRVTRAKKSIPLVLAKKDVR